VEGYRNLLVHGPLSLTIMLTVLRCYLIQSRHAIRDIEYRNLAPLYVEEEMKVCVKPKQNGRPNAWEVWIEGGDGGLRVRGTVHTEEVGEEGEDGLLEGLLMATDAGFGSSS
jgi:hydroxyacyl-ACP dehydratase HTD2-like protein with hotdog domain